MILNVVSLFRDSAAHLPRMFEALAAIERQHDVAYFFYENDSVDDTAGRLQQWMRGRPGHLITEIRHARKYGQTTEPARMSALAEYRNRIREHAIRRPSEWTLLLDSDVAFPPTIVEEFLDGAQGDVAMLTPRVEFDRACAMCQPPCGRAPYYDTFALRDRAGRRGVIRSCNPFWSAQDRHDWDHNRPIDVQCAFGGAALVRSSALANARWDSEGDCEHLAFARQLRAHGSILVVPSVVVRTRDIGEGTSDETFVMQRRLLDNPLLLEFWTKRNRDTLDSMRGAHAHLWRPDLLRPAHEPSSE